MTGDLPDHDILSGPIPAAPAGVPPVVSGGLPGKANPAGVPPDDAESLPDSFPGGTAVSRVRVYDWPTADGLAGGSPHLHTASTEAYVVVAGQGVLQTLSGTGYGEHALAPGTVRWFTPGTVHRLVNLSGDLELLVIMSNAGLPEAGDAVLVFPPDVLADPQAYARAAALPPTADRRLLAEAARRRRDLAVEGYLPVRERVRTGDQTALADLHRAAVALVRHRVTGWQALWRQRPLAQAELTGRHLAGLAAGQADHLGGAAVHTADPPAPRYGMCGHLYPWGTAGAAAPRRP